VGWLKEAPQPRASDYTTSRGVSQEPEGPQVDCRSNAGHLDRLGPGIRNEKHKPEAAFLHLMVQRLARGTEQKVKSVQAHRCYRDDLSR
jgi:hypothetical protein